MNGLSCVIPACNEKGAIAGVMASLQEVLKRLGVPWEIIVVDDGSTDGTSGAIVPQPNVCLVRHERRLGYGRSLSDGIAVARHPAIAIMDADGTYPVESLPELWKAFQGRDMVIGQRRSILLPSGVLPKSFSRKLLHIFARYLCGVPVPDLNSGYRIFRREFWEKYRSEFPAGFSFTTTLTLLTHFTGRSLAYVPIDYRPRIGTTKVHYFWDGFRVARWMTRLTLRHRPGRVLLPLCLGLALALRLAGAGFGLPATYHPDEPFHINTAVYFGLGHLNPHVFKYPTLWMYVLTLMYGVLFLFWSGFGLLRSAKSFSYLFIWNPTLFYLSARALSAALGTASVFLVYETAGELGFSGAGLIAALFCAVSPPLVYFGHLAKPDMLMLFFASAAWLLCARVYTRGRPADSLLAGAALGLAVSSQYTAALLGPLLLWAHVLRWREGRCRFKESIFPLVAGYGLLLLAFFAGTPFAILDHHTFLADIADLRTYGATGLSGTPMRLGMGIVEHFGQLLGASSLGIWILGIGLFAALRAASGPGLLIGGPLLWVGLALGSRDVRANVVNYCFSVFPGVALAMGCVMEARFPRRILTYVCLICAVPALIMSIQIDRNFLLPDTRTEAKIWIEEHIPSGSRLLLDQVHTGPNLVMSRSEAEDLFKKTEGLDHPRALYYERMLESHPGGGYEILRVQRTAQELVSMPRHTEWSQEGYEWLDVEEGLPALKKAGVQYVVWSSIGANRGNSPRLSRYFDGLESRALVGEFDPAPGSGAPVIRIYKID